MPRHKITMILLLVLVLPPALSWAWQGKVIGVSAGNIITVLHEGKSEKVLLYGIDCPEHRQGFSWKAKEFTSKIVFGKTVEVDPLNTDQYGRIVAIVSVDEKFLNEELLKMGLAWVYTQYCDVPYCSWWKRLQEDAAKDKIGLWSIPNPTPPWEFRQDARSSENEQPSPSHSKKKSKEANYLHGDTVTHVFHSPDCKDYNCRSCIVPFKTRDQAIRAGYRPCDLCNP